MLSILIPTYNTDITQLVDALYNQCITYGINYEIVFCEDASEQFLTENRLLTKKPGIIRIVNDKNLGRTATRAKLAEMAQYEWLLFLDADVAINNEDFITTYIQQIDNTIPILTGGTSYSKKKPVNKELRWKYGTYREARNAKERKEHPSYIISQNLLIKKEIFMKVNIVKSRKYGLDNVFSYQIAQNRYEVKHIDNPILHQGLEKNKVFLHKSLEAIDTLIFFEKEGLISDDFTKLQKAYKQLKNAKSLTLFIVLIKLLLTPIRNSLLSANPSLRLFDLYRLHHYIKLKQDA